jgi:hypothetical protein
MKRMEPNRSTVGIANIPKRLGYRKAIACERVLPLTTPARAAAGKVRPQPAFVIPR